MEYYTNRHSSEDKEKLLPSGLYIKVSYGLKFIDFPLLILVLLQTV